MRFLFAILAQSGEHGGEHGAEAAEPPILLPEAQELFWGAVAFGLLFFFMAKFVFPRINQTLEARRDKIQGDLEVAERQRREADQVLADYRQQLAGAREESNRIIEEARQQAEQVRRDLEARAQQEARGIVERAQEEIRAERDRVFQELKAQVGELSLALAGRMVGESLDRERHLRMVDAYIEDLAALPSGNGHGAAGGAADGAPGGDPGDRAGRPGEGRPGGPSGVTNITDLQEPPETGPRFGEER